MTTEELARAIYAEFRQKPDSGRIASEFALVELSKFLAEIKPTSVLEVGAGIGTITKLLLIHPDRPKRLTVTENHPICLGALETNLHGVETGGYELINHTQQIDASTHYDLVILDGTLDEARQHQLFKSGTCLFVEGSRGETINQLRKNLAARGLGLKIEKRLPGGKRLKLFSKRKFIGMRLPAFKLKAIKGCSIGQVTG